MAIDPRLEEILLRWDEQREQVYPIPLEELCRDQPDLLEQARELVRALEKVDGLIEEPLDISGLASGSTIGLDRSAHRGIPHEIATGAHYDAVRPHARGGLGEVFVAWENELGREVALKLIQGPHQGDPDLRARFLREAEITAGLGHPGIVPIFGIGRASDGRPCYAMRYIEGETLRAAIARFHEADTPDRDPQERALAFRGLLSRLIAVCQAVGFAHSRGVIHRDLKPDNVMLGPFQETLVVDWGLARRVQQDEHVAGGMAEPVPSDLVAAVDTGHRNGSEDLSLTRMGATLGTPGYMSPEQASGRWAEVGPLSDVYSLGATLYFILTGQPPFGGRSRAALLDRVRRGDFPPPRRVKANVPRALEAVCLKAMALRPQDRHAGVVELAADLEFWLADEPVSAWREPVGQRLLRWMRRHRPLVAGVAALAATGLVALGVSAFLLGQEQSRTQGALEKAQANFRLARTTTADMQTSFGLSAAERHAPAQAALWFAEAAETSDVDPEREFANRARARGWRLLSPEPVAVVQFNAPPPSRGIAGADSLAMAFDRRGRCLASLSKEGQCAVIDVATGQPVALAGQSRFITAMAWGGPDGDLLATGDAAGKTLVVRMPSGEVVDEIPADRRVWSVAFNGDGRLLAVASDTTRVRDVVKKGDVTPALAAEAHVVRLAFSPGSDRLASASADGRVRMFDVATPKVNPLFTTAANPRGTLRAGKLPSRLLFVDGGRGILIREGERDLVWLDAATGAEVRRLQPDLSAVHNVLLSPDGSVLIAMGLGGVRFWNSATGQPLGGIPETGIEAAAFTPNGEWLLLADGHYRVVPYRFATRQLGDWTFQVQDLPIQFTVAADGAHFAISQSDGLVRVWRLPSRSPGDRIIKQAMASSLLVMDGSGRLAMLSGKYFTQGPTKTQVRDLSRGTVGPELSVDGFLHGGAIAPDGRQVVTLSSPAGVVPKETNELRYPVGSAKGKVQFWDWEHGTQTHRPIETPSEPIGAAYDPTGRGLAVLCTLGEILLIDPGDGRLAHVWTPSGRRYTPGTPANELFRFSPNGDVIIEWGTGSPIVIDAATGKLRTPELSSPANGPHIGTLHARFSADGHYLATAGSDKTARVWEMATGRELAVVQHPDWVFQADFSADGSLIATACRDASARVIDWRTGRVVGPPLTHGDEVQDIRFLDGDRWVLTKSADQRVRLWDWRGGTPITPPRLVPGAWGSPLCVADDGRIAAIGSYPDQAIHVFGVADWLNDDTGATRGHLRELTELGAGQRIEKGSSVVNLTSVEWLERWRSYQEPARSTSAPAGAADKRPRMR